MTPLADLFRNIYNDTAYTNFSAYRLPGDTSRVDQSNWYLQVSTYIVVYHDSWYIWIALYKCCDP